jgi:hypothetical protein
MPRQHLNEGKKNITRVIQKKNITGSKPNKKKILQGGGTGVDQNTPTLPGVKTYLLFFI